MPIYLDTRGKSKLAVAVCDRCKMRCAYSDLISDGNSVGLKVCSLECRDDIDPWRLPPRQNEDISLQHARPDLTLTPGPVAVYAREFQAAIGVGNGAGIGVSPGAPATGLAVADPVSNIYPSTVWSAGTAYSLGATVTASNPVGLVAAPNLFNVFICIVPGISGAAAPLWNEAQGSLTTDNTVTWMNWGLDLEV